MINNEMNTTSMTFKISIRYINITFVNLKSKVKRINIYLNFRKTIRSLVNL